MERDNEPSLLGRVPDGSGPDMRMRSGTAHMTRAFQWTSAATWFAWFGLALVVRSWTSGDPYIATAMQSGAIVAFAWVQSLLLARILRRRATPSAAEDLFPAACHVPAILFAVVWGRHAFLYGFHHDEFGYFSAIGQNFPRTVLSFFEPLNEHFLPVTKLVQWAIYSLFGVDYFGIAAVLLLIFTLFLHALQLLLGEMGVHRWARIAVAACVGIWSSFADDHLWKAAGLNLYLSAAAFLLWLTICLRAMKAVTDSDEQPTWMRTILCIVTIFSSSQLTAPAIYLLILIPYYGRAAARLRPALTEAVALTGLYFGCRTWLAQVPLPEGRSLGLHDIVDVPGAFIRKNLFDWNWKVQNLVALSAAVVVPVATMALFRLRRRHRGDVVPIIEPSVTLGLAIFFVSVFQVWMGRGFSPQAGPESRHNFLPTVGLAIYLSGISTLARKSAFAYPLRAMRPAVLAIISGALLSAAWVQRWKAERMFPLQDRIVLDVSRHRFFASFERALCGMRRASEESGDRRWDVPDLSLAQCKHGCGLGLLPPFDRERLGFTLGYYAQAIASPCFDRTRLRFVPPTALDTPQRQRLHSLKEVSAFLDEYFAEPKAESVPIRAMGLEASPPRSR